MLLAVLCATGLRADQPVTVFAAASLKTALDDVAQQFEAETGDSVVMSYAGSSALARQIQAGAPADLFISANRAWMEMLVDQGMVQRDQVIDLLTNRLALIAPAHLDISAGFDALTGLADQGSDARIAMALVEAVPAGIYGKQALVSSDLWERIAPYVAQTDNVSAALRLVALGEAQLGVVYETDALADPRVQLLGLFATDDHDPILYPAALIGEEVTPGSRRFFEFLQGADAAGIFQKAGFDTVAGSR